MNQKVTIKLSTGKEFVVVSSLRTEVELIYFKNNGVLPYVLRKKVQ